MPSVEANSVELPLLRTTPFSHFLINILIEEVSDQDWESFEVAMNSRNYWPGHQRQPKDEYWRADIGVDHTDGQGLAEILISRNPTEEEWAWTPHSTELGSRNALADFLNLLKGYQARVSYQGAFCVSRDDVAATNVLSQLQGMTAKLGGASAVLSGVKFTLDDNQLEVGYFVIGGSETLSGTISGNDRATLTTDFITRFVTLAHERLKRYLGN